MKLMCQICGKEGSYDPNIGYSHNNGGGYFWVICQNCHWEGSSRPAPNYCPICGKKKLRDDHCFQPA